MLLGFFGVGLYNVAVEMAVETNFPLHPAKTASLLFLSAYLGEIAYILVAVFARRSSRRNPYPIENCHLYTDFEDYSSKLTHKCLKQSLFSVSNRDNLHVADFLSSFPRLSAVVTQKERPRKFSRYDAYK